VLITTGAGSATRAVTASVGSSAWGVSGRYFVTTNDAGKTWSASSLPFEPKGNVELHVTDSNILMSSDHGLFESRDGGQSWRQNSIPELLLEGMAVTGDTVVVSTRSGNLYVSRDQGRSWTRTATDVDAAGFASLQSPANGTSVIAASTMEGLFVLDTGGRQNASAGTAALAQPVESGR
jgi:photosystem II stability/assembly factor-like uncharacterized protein